MKKVQVKNPSVTGLKAKTGKSFLNYTKGGKLCLKI